jgi:tetratricopeptide (TPR) repeat protein
MGDVPAARRHWEASLRVAQLIGDERTAASANGNLGNLALTSGDYAEATERFEVATAYFSRIGDNLGVSIGMGALGTTAFLDGRVARAIEILDEGVVLARKVGNEGHLAGTLHSLGIARLAAGDHVTALAIMKETLAAARSAEEPSLVIAAIEGLAAIAAARSRWQRAVCLFGFADAFRRQTAIGDPITRKLSAPYLEMARAAMPQNEMKTAWDEGQRWTLEAALALVRAE